MLILRILFTVLSALCLGALIPVAILGWQYAVMCGLGAFLFFILMLLCKQAQEQREAEQRKQQNEDAPSNNRFL